MAKDEDDTIKIYRVTMAGNVPKVSISGYADKETGRPKHNMDLSKKRAAVVVKALQDAGIAAERISSQYFGDTVRVAPEPEKNRVSVCVTK